MRIIICLILICLVVFSSCNAPNIKSESDCTEQTVNNAEESVSEETISETETEIIKYHFIGVDTTNYITITDEEFEITVDQLEGEIAERILKILNDGKWNIGNTKTYSDISFNIDGNAVVYYSSVSGLFNDKTNKRNLKLSDEDTNFINSLIFKDNELSSSSVTVLKEFSDAKVTLNETQIEEFFKGFERDLYFESWRIGVPPTNYDLCFVLDGGRRIYYSTSGNILLDKEFELYCGATGDQLEVIKTIIDALDHP
jgi:hypothetical protein